MPLPREQASERSVVGPKLLGNGLHVRSEARAEHAEVRFRSPSAERILRVGDLDPLHVKLVGDDVEQRSELTASAREVHDGLKQGLAGLRSGLDADATTELETYVKLAPSGEFAKQAKALIAQLKK